MAGIDAEKNMYRHLMDVMERLEKAEKEIKRLKVYQEAEIRKLKKAHQEEINQLNAKHKAEVDALRKENNELRRENALLKEKLARLESNDHNNSNNSSLPPSTDQRPSKPKAANEYNSRIKSKRKSGGQKGHPGKALNIPEMEQRLKENGIQPEVVEIGTPGPVWKDRLVLDIPIGVKATLMRFYADKDGRINIPKEYENEITYGKNLKSVVVYLYGQGVQSMERTAEFVSGLTNKIIQLSEGTINNWLNRFHHAAGSVKTAIENNLLVSHQVNTDGTVVTLNGHQSYIRNFSIKKWVLYVSMESKGHEALSKIPFLQHFAGVLMHDHETSLYQYGTTHAECNVHLLRYLRKNTEDAEHQWSDRLISLLTQSNEYVKQLKASGSLEVPADDLKRIESNYDEILKAAAQEQKEHPCRFKWAEQEEKTLLNRLKKYKVQHLLFLHDFAVPFDNNMSERDLRKCKNRQKMSGGFRTESGKEIFCSVLSVIETCKRQSLDVFASIRKVFSNQPLFE